MLTVAPTTTTTATTRPPESTSARLLGEARKFAFRVRSVSCLATGSSFAVEGEIATNRHVASGSSTMQLSTWNGKDFTATVNAISPSADLAVLTDWGRHSGARLARTDAAPGTAIWAAGYPEGNQLSVLPGKVVDYVPGSTFDEPGRIMEITSAVRPGSSGSPVLDAAGEVVGVVFAISRVDGRGLAIPVSTVSRFLVDPGSVRFGGCIG
jgi:S1-C subfamily serine protease